MISALLSFLGGTAFRMLWGEISHWLTSRQDHRHEIERMRLQGDLDAAQHQRQQDAIRLQAEMGVKTIAVQAEADIRRLDAESFLQGVKATAVVTGIRFIDGWNACIRPAVATWAVAMLTLGEFAVITMSENALSVCSAALGLYLADRNLMKRGK